MKFFLPMSFRANIEKNVRQSNLIRFNRVASFRSFLHRHFQLNWQTIWPISMFFSNRWSKNSRKTNEYFRFCRNVFQRFLQFDRRSSNSRRIFSLQSALCDVGREKFDVESRTNVGIRSNRWNSEYFLCRFEFLGRTRISSSTSFYFNEIFFEIRRFVNVLFSIDRSNDWRTTLERCRIENISKCHRKLSMWRRSCRSSVWRNVRRQFIRFTWRDVRLCQWISSSLSNGSTNRQFSIENRSTNQSNHFDLLEIRRVKRRLFFFFFRRIRRLFSSFFQIDEKSSVVNKTNFDRRGKSTDFGEISFVDFGPEFQHFVVRSKTRREKTFRIRKKITKTQTLNVIFSSFFRPKCSVLQRFSSIRCPIRYFVLNFWNSIRQKRKFQREFRCFRSIFLKKFWKNIRKFHRNFSMFFNALKMLRRSATKRFSFVDFFLDEKQKCNELNVPIRIQFTIVSMKQRVFHLVNRWSLTSNKNFSRPIFQSKWKIEFLFYV